MEVIYVGQICLVEQGVLKEEKVELFHTVDVVIVVHGEEAGAAVEVIAGVVLGVRIQVLSVVEGEIGAASEEGDGITTDTVVLDRVSARAAVEIV